MDFDVAVTRVAKGPADYGADNQSGVHFSGGTWKRRPTCACFGSRSYSKRAHVTSRGPGSGLTSQPLLNLDRLTVKAPKLIPLLFLRLVSDGARIAHKYPAGRHARRSKTGVRAPAREGGNIHQGPCAVNRLRHRHTLPLGTRRSRTPRICDVRAARPRAEERCALRLRPCACVLLRGPIRGDWRAAARLRTVRREVCLHVGVGPLRRLDLQGQLR